MAHWDVSFEYQQHTFRLRKKENIFQKHTLIWRSGPAQEILIHL